MAIANTSTFGDATTATFWTHNYYMKLSTCTTGALKDKGIESVEDLREFMKVNLKAIFENLCKPAFQLDTSNPPKMKHVESYLVSTKSQKHLIVAAHAMSYYE